MLKSESKEWPEKGVKVFIEGRLGGDLGAAGKSFLAQTIVSNAEPNAQTHVPEKT